MQIDIIGGGYAGCSAAWTLLKKGHSIRLWEARSVLGGRARKIESSQLLASPESMALDNGQHLIAGAYHSLIQLIQSVYGNEESIPWQRYSLEVYKAGSLNPWFKPWSCFSPLNVLLGLLSIELPWMKRLQAVKLLVQLQNKKFQQAHPLVLNLKSLHPWLFKHLLEPLCLSILNTPVEKASTQRFAAVLKMAFLSEKDSDAIFVTTDLTALFPGKVLSALESNGHKVCIKERVNKLTFESKNIWHIHTRKNVFATDAVILATAPDQLLSVLREIPTDPFYNTLKNWINCLEYAPIATAYFKAEQLPKQPYPMVQLNSQPGDWLFNRAFHSNEKHAQYAIVISAAYKWSTLSVEERKQQIILQLEQAFCIKNLILVDFHVVNEKRATYCVYPNQVPPSKPRIGHRLYVAGDYLDPVLPATLEAAVISGIKAADALLSDI